MVKVTIDKNAKISWMVAELIALLKGQGEYNDITINRLEDGRVNMFFYRDRDKKDGFYIVGDVVMAEVGSN